MIIKRTIWIYLILSASLIVISCKCNDDNDDIDPEDHLEANALIRNSGDPSFDGCGWIIKIDTVTYKPINLDSAFQIDSSVVHIKYKIMKSSYACGLIPIYYKDIFILSIKNY